MSLVAAIQSVVSRFASRMWLHGLYGRPLQDVYILQLSAYYSKQLYPTYVPSISCIPCPVRSALQRPLFPSQRSFLTRRLHNLALPNPPRLLHVPFHLHQPRIFRQQQLRILHQRFRSSTLRGLSRELRTEFLVRDVLVARERLWCGRCSSERLGELGVDVYGV